MQRNKYIKKKKTDPELNYVHLVKLLTSLCLSFLIYKMRIKCLYLGLGVGVKQLDVTIQREQKEPYSDGIVKYLNCGDTFM